MFSALLWKEWRQLRLLRWSAVGLGVLAPGLLLALAEAGDRGWLMGPISNSSAATVVRELLPMTLGLALWPLLTLMAVTHALAGDRAAGTEAFLLERPVPRVRVWAARLLAALVTTLAFLASHVVVWWLSVLALGDPATFDMGTALGGLMIAGGGASAIALVAGCAAAALVQTPIQGVLLGLVFTAIPVGAGSVFSGFLFLGYRISGVRVGLAIPLLLLAGYLVGSYLSECRGEPAGRGRIRRGLVPVLAGLVAMPLFLAASAPVVLRMDARLGLGNTRVIPSPAGGASFVLNNVQRAGWLIDTEHDEPLAFFAPPVVDVVWNDHGDALALLHMAGGSGRVRTEPRLEVFDRTGARLGAPVDCSECRAWWGTGMVWSAGRLVVPANVTGGQGLLIVDPAGGTWETIAVPQPGLPLRLIEVKDTGEVQLLRFLHDRGDARALIHGELQRIDVAGATLGPAIRVSDVGSSYRTRDALSPSGNLWLRRADRRDEPTRVVDLKTGETESLSGRTAVWLAGDRLCWLAERDDGTSELMIGRPGAARAVRTFRGRSLHLARSPGLDQLLIEVRSPGETGHVERFLYVPGTDHWQEIPIVNDTWAAGVVQWAGPETLAVVEDGSLGLLEPSRSGDVRSVLGRPRS